MHGLSRGARGESAGGLPSHRVLPRDFRRWALGGASVALLAPRLFTSFAELPLLVIVALMVALLPPSRIAEGQGRRGMHSHWYGPFLRSLSAYRFVSFQVPTLPRTKLVEVRRDFFGVLRVQDHEIDRPQAWRALYSGRVLHGLQMKEAAARGRRPATTRRAAASHRL